MIQLPRFFQYFQPGEPAFWFVLVSIIAVGAFLLRRRHWHPSECIAAGQDINFKEADAWLPPTKEIADRRKVIRRGHGLVEVCVTDPQQPNKVLEGYIVNRSTEGIRVAVKLDFPTGSVLQVRAANAPAETPWTKVTVRNCEQLDDYYKLGCQFDEKVPWNVLLLFG